MHEGHRNNGCETTVHDDAKAHYKLVGVVFYFNQLQLTLEHPEIHLPLGSSLPLRQWTPSAEVEGLMDTSEKENKKQQ